MGGGGLIEFQEWIQDFLVDFTTTGTHLKPDLTCQCNMIKGSLA